jgi:hypothetical protein
MYYCGQDIQCGDPQPDMVAHKYPSRTPEYRRAMLAAHPEKAAAIKARKRAWYLANRERMIAARLEWRKLHRDRDRAAVTRSARKRRAENPAAVRQYNKDYYRRRKSDPRYSLPKRLRCRLRMYLQGRSNDVSAVRHLGCTVADLRLHIESQFQPGMTWDNWGRGAGRWHVDHVVPLTAAAAGDDAALASLCHYTNLRPMWGADNIRKGNRLVK